MLIFSQDIDIVHGMQTTMIASSLFPFCQIFGFSRDHTNNGSRTADRVRGAGEAGLAAVAHHPVLLALAPRRLLRARILVVGGHVRAAARSGLLAYFVHFKKELEMKF